MGLWIQFGINRINKEQLSNKKSRRYINLLTETPAILAIRFNLIQNSMHINIFNTRM